jgi:predicted PurR-regulated permease PerM
MIPNRPVSITITPGAVTKTILIVLCFYFLFLIRDLILVVLTAVVLASSIEPMTLWLGKYKIKRVPAVIIIYFCLALIFLAIIYVFLPSLLSELSTYLADSPKYLDYVGAWLPVSKTALLDTTQRFQELSGSFSLKDLLANIQQSLSSVSEGFVRSVGYIFGGVLSFVLIIVLSFYLAVQEAGIENFLRIITPNRHETYVMSLWKRTQIKIGLYMQGQLLLGLIIGILVFLGLTILGIKQALLLACLAAVFELIPIFGPILSAIPAILIGATSGGLSMGLIIAGLYTIIQQFENHLIYPLVVKKIVGVSPIIVILALIVGFKLAGFLGILLSVPISTAIMEYLNDLQKGRVTEDKAILTQ